MPIPKKETKNYSQLCLDINEKTKAIRNIQNLILTPTFEHVWGKANVHQQEKAQVFIKEGNKQELQQWMLMHESIAFGEKPWKTLMEHARWYQIKNYSRLSRVELIRALEEVKDAEESEEVGAEGK